MNSLSKRTQRGFTMIELILVITVISTLIVVGLRMFQQHEGSNQVDYTVQRFQQLMNASRAYYNGTGSWPSKSSDLYTPAGSYSRNTINPVYLPAPANGKPYYSNAWGLPFRVDSHPIRVKHAPSKTPNYLTISTLVPKNLANDVAATLPLSHIVNSKQYARVVVYVPIPQQSSNESAGYVSTMQVHKITHSNPVWKVPKPTCAGTNNKPIIIYGVESFEALNSAGQHVEPLNAANAICVEHNDNYNISLVSKGSQSFKISSLNSSGQANFQANQLSAPSGATTGSASTDGALVHGDLWNVYTPSGGNHNSGDEQVNVWYVTAKEQTASNDEVRGYIASPTISGLNFSAPDSTLTGISSNRNDGSTNDSQEGWVYALTRCVPASQIPSGYKPCDQVDPTK